MTYVDSFTALLVAVQARVPDLVILVNDSRAGVVAEVCRRIREMSRLPLLVLGAGDARDDPAEILLAGADDYALNSAPSGELEARVRALLRRNQLSSYVDSEEITAGMIRLDPRRAVCSVNGGEVRLTPNEFKLLRALALSPGSVVTHSQLIEQVWGSPYHASEENLRKLVQRVRDTLAAIDGSRGTIASIPGFGYSLEAKNGKTGES